jgi:(p)ppGpp synthase/HD superfamily hydrolase
MAGIAARYHDVPEYVLEAAVCHDVLEDTGTDPMELLAEGVSQRALQLVLVLTRYEEQEGYFDYVARIKAGLTYEQAVQREKGANMMLVVNDNDRVWGIRLKECDLADNLNPQRRVPGMKLPERYERALAMLRG